MKEKEEKERRRLVYNHQCKKINSSFKGGKMKAERRGRRRRRRGRRSTITLTLQPLQGRTLVTLVKSALLPDSWNSGKTTGGVFLIGEEVGERRRAEGRGKERKEGEKKEVQEKENE